MTNGIYKTAVSFIVIAAITFAVITLQSFRSETKSIIGNTISDFSLKNVEIYNYLQIYKKMLQIHVATY